MKKRPSIRYLLLCVLFLIICLIYTARLINIQISGQSYYFTGKTTYTTRRETITAQRGEIFDCNGKPLVINAFEQNMVFDYGATPVRNAPKNEAISQALRITRQTRNQKHLTAVNTPILGSYPDFYFDSDFFEDEVKAYKFKKILNEHNVSDTISCEDLVDHLLRYYGFVSSSGEPIYTGDDMYEVMLRRFDMEYCRFDASTPYVLATDIDISLVSALLEGGVPGIAVKNEATRTYCYPGYASHLLGRIGKIPAESADYYIEKGYPLNATVGISGCEAAFEEYLRGVDGVRVIEEDDNGYIVNEYIEVEPIAGLDVYLTIDMDLQMVAEDSLAETIEYIVRQATISGMPLTGEDAQAGATVVMDIETGGVLALASYPSFNLETFNQDYSELISNPASPLLNRALVGSYTPGSTFKLATAAAALTEGIINANTTIYDSGVYTYFKDYQPACWIYNAHGYGHGSQNVTLAIQNSCNYFFFDVGRKLTIEKLDRYCEKLGLGQKTGIELAETAGVLDGKEYRESEGLEWNGGDVLQVAIGQGQNQFSPLQITNYIATLINGGKRYSTHILSDVRQYGTNAVVFEKQKELLSEAELSDYNRNVILYAMKDVVESGSAASVFSRYPISIGGKTGTAQVNENKSANAVFTGFAPFNNPKIAVTTVIEQGNSGTTASRDLIPIFDQYFGLNQDEKDN